jgi:hypothetical protein
MDDETGHAGAEPGAGGMARELLLQVARARHDAAMASVAQLRAEHPTDSPEELANRLIRQCIRDLAINGAVSGGAAASPVAGPAAAAAVLGTESAASVSRLGEMVMAIGIVLGSDRADPDERALFIAAALGMTEGAAMGLTGLAAKAGARGGARVLQRLPSAAAATAAGAGRSRRLAARMAGKGGPWGLAALLPYTIGAGVGAAGNGALALSVGRAAKHYFGSGDLDPGSDGGEAPDGGAADDELWDAEVVEERILDDEA